MLPGASSPGLISAEAADVQAKRDTVKRFLLRNPDNRCGLYLSDDAQLSLIRVKLYHEE